MKMDILHFAELANSLQCDILRTLLYFDVFNHPLRAEEILHFLPSNSVNVEDIRNACLTEPLRSSLNQIDNLYLLNHSSESVLKDRKTKERRARYMWKMAFLMASIIKRFPFVRAVFVSGELSKGVASKNSDIDFFVVSAHNRVWIVRTLFTIFKKTILLNQRKFFCYNHIVSERHLEIAQKNIYTATEVVTLRPVINQELYEEFLKVNSWTNRFLPNSRHANRPRCGPSTPSPIAERVLTAFISPDRLDMLDRRLLSAWKGVWSRRYPELSKKKRGQLFQCTIHVSTAYVRDFLDTVTQEYDRRLRKYGLSAGPSISL